MWSNVREGGVTEGRRGRVQSKFCPKACASKFIDVPSLHSKIQVTAQALALFGVGIAQLLWRQRVVAMVSLARCESNAAFPFSLCM